MVHDMRAPLRAIINFGDLMKREGEGTLSHSQQGYLERMRAASVRMDHLICDMLKYSSLLSAKLPLSPVNVSELVRQLIAKNSRFHAEEGRIEVETDMPLVRGNGPVLAQCFSALVDNALRYCRLGVAPKIWVRGKELEGWVRISVEDNGMGMTKEFHVRLFGIFQKGTKSTEGSGIGLALVRVAVERMGGRVGATSQEGAGSTFWIDLRPAGLPGQARIVSPRRPMRSKHLDQTA
jgi:signal transduction histidine kinase